jgi:hypothetical protein
MTPKPLLQLIFGMVIQWKPIKFRDIRLLFLALEAKQEIPFDA